MKKKITAICIATLVAISGAFALSQMPQAVKAVKRTPTTQTSGLIDLAKQTPQGAPKHRIPQDFKRASSGTAQLPFFNKKTDMSVSNPMKISASGATVYGFLGYSTAMTDEIWQWDEIRTDGEAPSMQFQMTEYVAAGCIRDGKINGYSQVYLWGMVSEFFFGQWDMKTGAMLTCIPLNLSDLSNAILSMAYDPSTDKAYVYTFTPDGESYQFCSIDLDEPEAKTVIKEIDDANDIAVSFTRSPKDGKLYGINMGGLLMDIDPATGEWTEVFDTGLAVADYITGLCYSIKDNAFIWNANLADDSSALYKIDVDAQTCEKIYDFSNYEDYTFLTAIDEVGDENAPAKPEVKTIDFAEGSLSGTITYKIPSKTYNGNSISGQVNYVATVDGTTVAEGKAWGGEFVKVSYTDLSQGTHMFNFAVTDKEGLESPTVITSLYIGYDNPKAPENVKFTLDGISWDAVTDAEGEHGGYVDVANITYEVYVDKQLYITTTDTSVEYSEVGGTLASHTAEVVAISNSMKSKPGVSNSLLFGEPMELPLYIEPDEEDISLCTIQDNNKDGRTWGTYFTGSEYFFVYSYASGNDADDWLMLPPANFDSTSEAYSVSVDYCVPMTGYPESFEVYYGKNPIPSEMIKVGGVSNISNTSWQTFSEIFSIEETGIYYVAIRCNSMRDMFDLRVRNIVVEKSNVSTDGPDVATELTAIAASEGELMATVTFVMPQTTLSGENLDSATELVATITSPAESITVSGMPGSSQTAQIATNQGYNEIRVQVAAGDKNGKVVSTTVYTGFDYPGAPENLTGEISEDNMTIHLSWDAPSQGANGGYILPNGEGMSYNIILYDEASGWYFDESVAPITGTSYDYQLPEDTPQNIMYVGVVASNEAGMSPTYAYATFIAGKPYELPMKEDFLAGYFKYNPIVVLDQVSTWEFLNPSMLGGKYENATGMAAVGYLHSSDSGTGRISLPKFSTENAQNPYVLIDVYCGEVVINIYAESYGIEPVKIVSSTDINSVGWNTLKVELPDQFTGKKWVMVSVEAEFTDSSQFALFSTYEFKDYVAHDLALAGISAPQSIFIGKECNISARITNYGFEAQGMPNVKCDVFKGDQLLFTESKRLDVNTVLEDGQSIDYNFTFNVTADHVGELTAVATILDSDLNDSNNSASTQIKVGKGNAIVVTDLAGEVNENGGIDLTWTAPEFGSGDESFENCDLWSYGSMIADFKNVDGDGLMQYSIYGLPVPDAEAPKAFQVYNIVSLDPVYEGLYPASDGDVYIAAFCPMEPAENIAPADDWLISPELKPGSSFSFDMATFTESYGPEIVEILVSTTTDKVEAFSLVETINKSLSAWETYSYTLPADAKYFAIHYISTDVFGIMLDNFHYDPAIGADAITGYDIARNDELLAENTAAECKYTDSTVAGTDSEYTYYVVPVVEGKRHEKSNTVTLNPTSVGSLIATTNIFAGKGFITAKGYDGLEIRVWAADGTNIAKINNAGSQETIRLNPGIYVVKAGKTIAKVIVK